MSMGIGNFFITVGLIAFLLLHGIPVFSQVPMYEKWFQESVPIGVESDEIQAFITSALAIQEIQQRTQQAMWQYAIDNEMDVGVVYHLEKEIKNNPEAVYENIPGDVIKRYKKIIRQTEEYEDEMQDLFIRAIEATGLSVDRFAFIKQQIDQDYTVTEEVLELFENVFAHSSSDYSKEFNNYVQPIINNLTSREVSPDYPPYIYHLTIPGTTLWDVSAYYYGTPDLWPVIYESNSYRVIIPRRLRIGDQLRVPTEYLTNPPDPWLTVDDKYEIISDIFPLDSFRRESFAYIAQELELHSQIQVYSTLSDIQSQIRDNQHLRGELTEAPDFLSLLIPIDQLNEQKDKTEEPDIALNNMVIDETRSPFGGDYFDRFRSQLEFPEGQQTFFVRVIEHPVPGRASQIAIEVNHEVVYQFQLQPGYEQVIEIADASADGLSRHLNEYQIDSYKIY